MYLLRDEEPEIVEDRRSAQELTASRGAYVDASFWANYELNPALAQRQHTEELFQLQARPEPGDPGRPMWEVMKDQFGFGPSDMAASKRGRLDPNDPRARRLGLEEANELGKEIGLRFSEPPTQGQFDYLARLKREENERESIIARTPGGVGTFLSGLTAGLAATAIDPANIATAFVPVVGPARRAQLAARFGKWGARAATGAAEGAVGTAMVIPHIYGQAQTLQQNYDGYSAFMDLVFGTTLGSGLHMTGGALVDAAKVGRRLDNLRAYMRETVDRNLPTPEPFDARRLRVQTGDNAIRHQSLGAETGSNVLKAAVSAAERDKFPKVSDLLAADPKMASLAIPDKRFPATLRLRAPFSAADHAVNAPGTGAVSVAIERSMPGVAAKDRPRAFFDKMAKRYKKLKDYSLNIVSLEEFNQRAQSLIEHPDQKAVLEPGSKTILVTDGASLGAVRHEIERALDDAYGLTGEARGGYRYNRRELDAQNAHMAAVGAMTEATPDRAPKASSTPREAVDLFSRDNTDIMGSRGVEADATHWDAVQEGKDKDLETRIKEEEQELLGDVLAGLEADARGNGIVDKVITLEERQLLEAEAPKKAIANAQRDLFKAVDEAVEKEIQGEELGDVELLIRGTDAEQAAKLLRNETTPEAIIAKAADDGLVTRLSAAKWINHYLRSEKIELDGEALERAIRAVQDGEDIDVAVRSAMPAEDGAGKAEEAPPAEAKAEEAGLRAADEEDEDWESELIDDVVEMLKNPEKRELARAEAALVKAEQDALEANPGTRDLFSPVERDEFDAADSHRALQESPGIAERGEGAGSAYGGQSGAFEEGLFAPATIRRSSENRGSGSHAERAGEGAGSERSAPDTTISYGGWHVPRRVITPDGSVEVSVEPLIVELRDLDHATGDLQVRDRSRKESEVEALERARKLDPERLLPNRVADAGSPIVIRNEETGRYTIISGNGRTISLRKVYSDETLGWKARQYRERLGPAADGYRSPILVLRITDELSHAALVKFAERANRSSIAEMSITEKAQRDADVAGYEIMSLYQGGDFTKRENQQFLRLFMRKVATAQEMGEMSKNGVLTKTGLDRLNAAVLAAAFDDTGVLSLMLESTDLNIKSIASAYRDVAPVFMRLRAEIAQGLVREEMDITPFMMEAARFVQEARDKGTKISNALAQVDAFNPMDPVVDRLIRQFYNPQLTRARSAPAISETLRLYADSALQKRVGGFFEDTTTPLDVMGAAERRFEREADETVIADDEDVPGEGPGTAGPEGEVGGAVPARADAQGGSSRASEAAPDRQAAEAAVQIDRASRFETDRDDIYPNQIPILDIVRGRESSPAITDSVREAYDLPSETKSVLIKDIVSYQRDVDFSAVEKYRRNKNTKFNNDDILLIPITNSKKFLVLDGNNRISAAILNRESSIDVEVVNGTIDLSVLKDNLDNGKSKSAILKTQSLENTSWREILANLGEQELRDELGKLTVPALREQRKAQGIEAKGRSKAQIIDGIVDGLKKAPARQEAIAAPGQPGVTQERLLASAAFRPAYDALGRLIEDAGSPVVGKMDRKAQMLITELKNMAVEARQQADVGNVDEARRIVAEMSGRVTKANKLDRKANLVTQWARQAERNMGGEPRALTDEEIDALPEPDEPPQTPSAPVEERSAFYDYLEGDKPVRGAGTIAKALGIPVEGAYRLIDEAVDAGWLKQKDNGDYIRVPKARRPVRPDFEQDFADVVSFQTGKKIKTDHQLDAERMYSLSERVDHLRALEEKAYESGNEAESRKLIDEIDEVMSELSRIKDREDTRIDKAHDDEKLTDIWEQLVALRKERVELMDQINEIAGPSDIGDFAVSLFDSDRIRELQQEALATRQAAIAKQDAFAGRRLAVLQKRLDELNAKHEALGEVYNQRMDDLLNSFADVPRGWGSIEAEEIASRFEREMQAQLSIQKAIGNAINRMPEAIQVRIASRIEFPGHSAGAAGRTISGTRNGAREVLIELSRAMTRNPENVMNHELVHALHRLGLFTGREWELVRMEAAKAGGIGEERMGRYRPYLEEVVRRSPLSEADRVAWVEDKLVEEWFATDHGNWAETRSSERETFLGRLHQRVRDFVHDLNASLERWISRSILKKEERLDLQGLYRSIEDGTVGRRYAELGAGKAGADNRLSAAAQALDNEARMYNDMVRTIADEKHMAVGRAIEGSLQAMAPCAAYHL